MAAFKGTQDTLGPRFPPPPKKQRLAHSRGPVRPLGGEGEGERERERERQREKGMWVDQGGGGLDVFMSMKTLGFLKVCCGDHNLYKHVQKLNTCPVLIGKD